MSAIYPRPHKGEERLYALEERGNLVLGGGHEELIMEIREKEDQLCWNCKRCTNPTGLECPWAGKGVPVEGWTAAQGREYYKYNIEGKKVGCLGTTYIVKECPLYVKDKPYGTYSEALQHIAETLGLSPKTVAAGGSQTSRYVERYEELTGERIPNWIKNHTKERKLFGDGLKTLDK